jgi:hypothetical protein
MENVFKYIILLSYVRLITRISLALCLSIIMVTLLVESNEVDAVLTNNFNNNSSASSIIPTKSTRYPLTLGNLLLNYTESDKSSIPQPEIINGTHMLITTYGGNGTIKNIAVTDTGTAYTIPKGNNSAYSYGRGFISAKDGSGTSMYIFNAQGHYSTDGTLHDIGASFSINPTGSLSFLSNNVGIYKDWYDNSGHGMTTAWLWKQH